MSYVDELMRFYRNCLPSTLPPKTAEEWAQDLDNGDQSDADIMRLIYDRDAAREEADDLRATLERVRFFVKNHSMRAIDELDAALSPALAGCFREGDENE